MYNKLNLIFLGVFLTIIVGNKALAKDKDPVWKTITPFSYCENFQIQYATLKDHYLIRYLDSETKKHTHFNEKLKDINDLSLIDDQLTTLAKLSCPENSGLIQVTDISATQCVDPNKKGYTDGYVSLIRDVSKIVNKKGNPCENIIPYMQLQSEIESLEKKDLIKFRKSKKIGHRIIKLFGTAEDHQTIDHFNACGGKKGSQKFIENFMLMNASAACIMPKPPGYLTWDEAKEVASKIAKEYKNTGLLGISKKKAALERKALLAFTEKVIKSQVQDNLGAYMEDTDAFVENMDSYKKLQKFDNLNILSDYISLGFGIDAPIEAARATIPLIIKANFSSSLPDNMTQEEKDKFMDEEILAYADESFDICISKFKNKLYDGEKSSKEKFSQKEEEKQLTHRVSAKEKYCDKNPDQCNEETCGGSVNILTESAELTDMDAIVSCTIDGITRPIESLLAKIIEKQALGFEEDFALSEDRVKDLSNRAWDVMVKCIDTKIATVKNDNNLKSVQDDTEAYDKINTEDYQEIVISCTNEVEHEVTTEFTTHVILNNKSIANAFAEDEQTEWQGHKYPKKLFETTQNVMNESFEPCYEKMKESYINQNEQNSLNEINPLYCAPIIEISAGKYVITEKLNNMLTDLELIDNERAKETISLFNGCANKAKNNAVNDLGSNTSKTPINNTVNSNEYLDTNHEFYECVKTVVTDISAIAGEESIDQMVKDLDGKITNINFLKSKKPEIVEIIRSCFERKLSDTPNWTAFNKMTEIKVQATENTKAKDGMDLLVTKCTAEAEQFIVPKLLIKEVGSELAPMKKDGFIKNNTEIGNVLALTAYDLRKKYNVEIPEGTETKDVVEKSFALVYQAHLDTNPNNTMDSFIAEYSALVEAKTIRSVHKTLMKDIIDKTSNINEKSKFSSFDEYFNQQCLEELYNRFIKTAKPTPGSDPVTMDKLSTYLQKGLSYNEKADPADFWNSMKELKTECSNMDQYKTEKEFFHSKFYGLIVKAQIHELFNEQFTKGIMGNLADMEANLKNPYKAQKLAHINQMQKEMKELLKNRISSPSSFESLIFSDGTIMKFAGDNLDKILADDPVKMKELTNKLIMKAFQESGEHSFADRFAQIQIEGQVGIEGIEDAVAQANEEGTWMKIGSWRFGPNNYAMGSAKEFFGSTAKVKSVVNWKNLPIEERKIMSTSIMYDAVLESQNERAYPADTGLKVMQAISGGSSSYDTYVIGGIKLKGIISKATDNATNGYVNYNQTVEKQAKSYAVTWYKKYPKLKSSMTKAQLENYLVTKIKEEHMNRNVTDRLLSLKDKNGKTIEDRIATKIKKRTTNKVWGNTPEQKARVQKRRMQEATNPWPIGPKY